MPERALRALDQATRRLAAAGVPSPRVDAELLLAAAVGVPRSRLALLDEVSDEQLHRYLAMLNRRAEREPLQHIVGRAPFRHLEVTVGPGVFVPRPETELLVDAVLPHLPAEGLAVDLCSGSGALALALADEVPGARVVAVERFAEGLEWLRRNAARARVHVVAGDVADPALLRQLRGAVDVVVSNPPYVPERTTVAPEVRRDPAEAVFAGADGLAVIRHILARAAELLHPGGVLALEHDESHEQAVPALLAAAGDWDAIAEHLDLAGRPRFATAKRR
jgi:release factor glutamine methyltransferase